MTNEQRAHDIAVAMIPIVIEDVKAKTRANADEYKEQSEISLDAFEIYASSYDAALSALNKKFPVCKCN